MSAERKATAGLANVLNQAGQAAGGIREVLRTLDLEALADAPIETVYASLVDIICPPNGDLDDAHAREAYLEAVTEIIDRGYADIEHPSARTVSEIVGTYITNVICVRVINAIANGLVTLPADEHEVRLVEAGMKDFIRGCVDDAFGSSEGPMPVNELQSTIDDLFSRAIEIIDYRADIDAEGGEG